MLENLIPRKNTVLLLVEQECLPTQTLFDKDGKPLIELSPADKRRTLRYCKIIKLCGNSRRQDEFDLIKEKLRYVIADINNALATEVIDDMEYMLIHQDSILGATLYDGFKSELTPYRNKLFVSFDEKETRKDDSPVIQWVKTLDKSILRGEIKGVPIFYETSRESGIVCRQSFAGIDFNYVGDKIQVEFYVEADQKRFDYMGMNYLAIDEKDVITAWREE